MREVPKHFTILAPIAALALCVTPLVARPASPVSLHWQQQGQGQLMQQQTSPQERVQKLLDGIELSQDQQAQVDSITARYESQLQGVSGDDAKAVQDQEDQEIRAILTPDQQAKFDENKSKLPPS